MEAMEAHLAEFVDTGVVVIPDVLSPDEVAEARALIEAHRTTHMHQWSAPPAGTPGAPLEAERAGRISKPQFHGEGGRWQSNELFADDASFDGLFDRLMAREALMPLVREIMGDDICLRTFWSMVRMPLPEPPPPPGARDGGSAWPQSSGIHWQAWHRESGGLCLPDHPYFAHSVQVKIELDDLDSNSHCISIVPESLEQKKRLPLSEERYASRRRRPGYVEPAPVATSAVDVKRRENGLMYIMDEHLGPGWGWQNTFKMQGAIDVCCKAGSAIVFNVRGQ